MKLELTSKEMEILLSLTANHSFNGDDFYSLWEKVSAEFCRTWDAVRDSEKENA